MFPELCFVHYQYNKALVYPDTLPIDEVVLNNFMLKSELEAVKVVGEKVRTTLSELLDCHITKLKVIKLRCLGHQMKMS